MSESLKHAVRAAVLRLLHPLVKLLLDAGLGVGDFMSLVKVAYVRAAREQGRESGGEIQRPNASRIAVVTGLTRVEVAAILKAADDEPTGTDRGRQRAERVLAGWWNDPEFQDETGRPAALPLRGKRRSFAALCQRYSGDRRSAPLLDELMRVRAVRRLPDGTVEAISRTYATVRWDPAGIAAVGEELGDHCASLVNNLKNPSRPRFTRRVLNARLDPRYAPVLMRDLERQAATLADSVDEALNDPLHCIKGTAPAEDAVTLGLGVYLFEESGGGVGAVEPEGDPGVSLSPGRRRRAKPKKRGIRTK
jgi:hypothetical protein